MPYTARYIFSDKTGTLTRNERIFRRCSIGDILYGSMGEEVWAITI